MTFSQRWGRRLGYLALGLFAWAAVIAATGGFLIELGSLRISSRNATRVALIGAVFALIAWRLAYREHARRAVRALAGHLARIEMRLRPMEGRFERGAALLAGGVAIALLVLGLGYGGRVAGGADAFGYISQAALLAKGHLGIDQSYARALPWPGAAGAFVPLAYRLGANDVMGPTVAPGLPLLMALAGTLSACGPYLVVPFCGAVLVLATFWLGRRLFGSGQALVAAALVACSPVVVFESLVVMADVPTAAFWICSLAVALRRTGTSTLGAGLLAGVAILIRPNLLPLAAFPWLLTICRLPDVSTAAMRTGLFATGSVPAAIVIASINHSLYGSAFTSGYGDLGSAFALSHAAANIELYSGWWLESHGFAGLLFLVALWPRRAGMTREVVVLIAYAMSACLLYLFYLPFDQWWYLRFLVPAIPIVMLLCADAVAWATRWSSIARVTALTALLLAAMAHNVRFMDAKDILSNQESEKRRYLDAAVYFNALPTDAVVLAMQHAGSVRYYSGRLTMRWDVLDSGSLDAAVEALRVRGVPTYAALESWEEVDFRRRFAGQRTVELLDSGAVAKSEDGELRLYAFSGDHAETIVIPRNDSACVEGSPDFITPGAVSHIAQRP